jgi:antitoxin (DNA-binding transcriptional repressor) of toxin-antitoxin stability system
MVMETVTMHELSSQLQELIALAKEGTEIFLVENDKPVVRLARVEEKPKGRIPGLHAGSMRASDDFDEELPDSFWLGEDA